METAHLVNPIVIVDLSMVLVRTWHWCEKFKTVADTPHYVRETCGNLCSQFRINRSRLVLVADDPRGDYTGRRAIYPQYKMNRTAREEQPERYAYVAAETAALAEEGWTVASYPGWEADDLIAAVAMHVKGPLQSAVIVTSDKDLLQLLPVWGIEIYRPTVSLTSLEHWSPERFAQKYPFAPERFIDYLVLRGDQADGIPGVPGIGEVNAARIIQEHIDLGATFRAIEQGASTLPKAKQAALLKAEADLPMLYGLVRLRSELPEDGAVLGIPVERWLEWQEAAKRKIGE